MDDYFSLFKALRKIEALFLPFMPRSWRKMPPSYRMAGFFMDKLSVREKTSPWVAAITYSIRNGFYRAYHEKGLPAQGQSADAEMQLIRMVLALIVGIVAFSFTPWAHAASPYVKAVLVMGSGALLIFGSMGLSISALWASWGLLFPLMGSLVLANAPWFLIFLGGWVLLWHIPALKKEGSWRWYDWLATLPVLFFWMRAIAWIPWWSSFQNGCVSFTLWCLVCLGLNCTRGDKRIGAAFQLFFPASLFCLMLTVEGARSTFFHWRFYLTWKWFFWGCASFLLAFCVSFLEKWIAHLHILFRFRTIAFIFAAFGLGAFLSNSGGELKRFIDVSQSYLHSATWPLWWFIGAGIIMLIRRSAMILFNWVQAIPRLWLMPALLLIFMVTGWYLNWFPFVILRITETGFWGWVLTLTSGAMVLAVLRKKIALKEWAFWGLYILFLLNRYGQESHRVAHLTGAPPGALGFFLLTTWLMWLSYSVAGDNLAGLQKDGRDGVRAAALVGSLLWLLSSSLWSFYVDHNTIIRREISFELFMGFNFFGIFLIIYHMITVKYLNPDEKHKLPWHWIILFGILLVQILQCAEHYLVALHENLSLNDLHLALHGVYVDRTQSLGKTVPAWVLGPVWDWSWKAVRWAAAMLGISFLVLRGRGQPMPGALIITGTCLTSLAAAVAESYWLQLPSMAPYWSVVFRPWRINATVLGWNVGFLKLFGPYALAGLAWGSVLNAVIRRKEKFKAAF